MRITPEILRDYISQTIRNVELAGDTRKRFRDVRLWAVGEAPSAEYLYLCLPGAEEPSFDMGEGLSLLLPRLLREGEQPPAGGCVICAPCEPEALLNQVRECFLFYNEWFGDIYEAVARGEGMEAILEKCYPVLKNPIFIDDSSYRTLARLKDYPSGEFRDDEYIFMQQNGHHSAEYIYAMLNSSVAIESSAIAPRPIIHRFDFLAHRTLYSTLKVDGEIVGFFSCLELETPFTDGLMDVFESLTELLSIALSRESGMPTTRQKGLNNDLFLGILNGSIRDPELAQAAFSQMGLVRGGFLVTYITTSVDIIQNPFLLPRIMELLETNLERNSFAVADGANIVLVIKKGTVEDVRGKLIQLIRFYLREFEVSVGISMVGSDPKQLPFYFDQALTATRLGPFAAPGQSVFEYGEVVGYDLLERFGDAERRRTICHPVIFELMAQDREKQANLLPTLRVYIECMGDTALAAERLYLHRNSMYYRLKQIVELTGIDLHDEKTLSHIMTSLRVMELDGEL